MSTLDHMLEPKATAVRRLEVITGSGPRRRFSTDDKARIIEETLAPGAIVSDVARRHGLSPQQLFTWRCQARRPAAKSAGAEAPSFVPAVVDAERSDGAAVRRKRQRLRRAERTSGIIEVEIEGVTVRVGRGAEAKTVAAVLRALRGGA